MYLRSVKKLFSQEVLRRVDEMVVANPLVGVVIQGTNGVRKLRVAMEGKGKRGGARVIYYFWREGEAAYMIYAYGKNQQEDLLPAEKKTVSQLALLIQRGEYEN
jgi:hypothetical protein